MSKEIENAIEETINTGFDFKLGIYFSDGRNNCKNAIIPNWGFMTLAIIMSIIVGVTPYIGIFILIGYVVPALIAGIFYYIHHGLKGENTFGDFFKGFFNANILGYFWLVTLISILISAPSMVYFYSLGLYDPLVQIYELIVSGDLEAEQILALSEELKRMQDEQGGIYKVVYYVTLVVSSSFTLSQFVGYPILVSSNTIGPVRAMVYSFKLCIKQFVWLLLLYIMLGVMNYVGAIVMTLGLIVTIPFSAGIVYSIYKTEVLSKLDNNQTPLSGSDDLLDV